MADYTIVIKACSKIVCHALSSIETKAMLWILFSGFARLFTVYLYLIFFFMLGFTGLFIVYLYPIFFLLGPLRDVNFTQAKGFIRRFDHIFHG